MLMLGSWEVCKERNAWVFVPLFFGSDNHQKIQRGGYIVESSER
jgi:hypothetical protein